MTGEAAPIQVRHLEAGSRRLESGLWAVLAAAWPYALVSLVGVLILLPKLGAFGFWDPWEPKYAQSAREMVARGSYIVPYYLDEVRLAKPILAYWGVLTGTQVFGDHEFGARFAGVVIALGSMLGVYYAVSLLRGRRAGLLAAVVLGTLPQFYTLARLAMPDVYLMTSLGSALLFFALGIAGPDRRRDLHFVISYVCFALAVLAKGPVLAGVIFLATLVVYAVARLDLTRVWKPDLRGETVRLFVVVLPALALLAASSFTSFLFGTSPRWWSYSRTQRENIGAFRDRLQDQLAHLHAPEILLGLLAVGAAAAAFRLLVRRPARSAAAWTAGTALGAISVATIATLALAGTQGRILAASLLGLSASAFVIAFALRRFLRESPIATDVAPYLKPVARQAGLFTAITLAIAGPWYLGIMSAQGEDFFTEFIIRHNIERVEETINRTGASDFYFRALIFGLFPWCVFLPIALSSAVEWWRGNRRARLGVEAYLLIATCVIFSAFSAATTKFSHYLAPLLIPAAVLIGLTIDRLMDQRRSRAATLAWIVAAMLYLPPMFDLIREDGAENLVRAITMKDTVPASAAPGALFHGILYGIAALLLASILIRSRLLVGGLLAGAVLLGFYVNDSFIPRLSDHKSMRRLCESFDALRQTDAPLGYYGDTKHGLYYYTDRTLERLQGSAAVVEYLAPGERSFCIVLKKRLPGVQQAFADQYPDAELYVADRSHFEYKLISNQPVGEAVPLSEHLAYDN